METASLAPSVTTEVTAEDLYRFSWLHLCHEPSLRWRLWISYFVVVGTIVWELAHGLTSTLPVLAGVAITCAAPCFYRWQLRWDARRAVRAAPENYGIGTLQLRPECIHERSNLGEVTLAWAAIRRIVVTSEAIYFYRGPHTALIVPRRCFASPDAAETFITAARQFHAAATFASSDTRTSTRSGSRR